MTTAELRTEPTAPADLRAGDTVICFMELRRVRANLGFYNGYQQVELERIGNPRAVATVNYQPRVRVPRLTFAPVSF